MTTVHRNLSDSSLDYCSVLQLLGIFASRFALVVLCSLLIPSLHHCYARSAAIGELEGLLQAKKLRFSGGQYVDEAFGYRLFIPVIYDRTKKFPLLVWMHGAGTRGSDNRRQMAHLRETIFLDLDRRNYPFFLIALQTPKGVWCSTTTTPSIDSADYPGDELIDVLLAVIDKTQKAYPIDKDRVSLIGLSSGGNGAWELAVRRPEQFAAVLPFAASPPATLAIERLVDVPVWAFHSPNDMATPPYAAIEAVNKLKSLGGRAALTLTEDHPGTKNVLLSHFPFESGFRDYGLLKWILRQSRSSQNAPKPGRLWLPAYLPSINSFTSVIAPTGILVLLWVCRRHVRHYGRGVTAPRS
jgi:predicted esterase